MFQHSDATISRRQFIKTVLGSTAALTVFKLTPAAAAPAASTRWALFSDTHIKAVEDIANHQKGLGYYDPHGNLARGVAEALSGKRDGVIITGDLARMTGELGDYEKLGELLAPLKGKLPFFPVMGNHDDRDHYATVLPGEIPGKQAVPGKLVLVIEQGPARFIILDSMMATNKTPGLLGPEQLDWLRKYLAEADDRPTILYCHHVPTRDEKDFIDAAQLFEIAIPAKKVKAIVYGHSHEYVFAEREGIHLVNLPAMGYSFSKKDEAVGWVDARFTAEGGAFTMHVLAGPKGEDGKAHRLKWR